MCSNDEFVGRVLNRREIVAMLGAAGAWMLMGCSTGDDDDGETSVSASDPTPTTSATTSATNTPASGPESADPSATSATGPTATADDSADPAASEQSAADIAATAVIPTCVVSPELTEGPYFVDEGLNRADIRTDPSSGAVVAGAQFDLALRVLQVTSDGCAPLAGAQVDVWHCDAEGVYSDVDDPGFSTLGQQFLRGYQLTGDDGVARFTTIYPGWYQGRTVHIHFKVRSAAGTGVAYEFTSQFFFDDDLSDDVYASAPYAGKGDRGTRNSNDGIYQQASDQLLLDVVAAEAGYAASFDIGVLL